MVLSELGERLGRYATKKLRAAGIDLRLGRRVRRVDVDRVELDDGTSIPAATVVSTVGNAPNPLDRRRSRRPATARGWPTPDATFALPGVENVWAVGDCASIIDPSTGRPMPSTAQHAIREGPHVARNVLAALDGKPQAPFAYGQLGMLVSIGRFKAVGEILGIKVSGLLGWFAVADLLPASPADARSPDPGRPRLDPRPRPQARHRRDRRPADAGAPRRDPRRGVGEPVSMGARPEAPDELVL